MTHIITACLLSSVIAASCFGEEPHHHGKGVELGELTLLGIGIDLESESAITPGAEVHLDVKLTPATAAYKAVRAWVGPEKGRVTKSSITGSNGALHGHVDVPKPLPAEARLWIEIEPLSGSATRASVALPASK